MLFCSMINVETDFNGCSFWSNIVLNEKSGKQLSKQVVHQNLSKHILVKYYFPQVFIKETVECKTAAIKHITVEKV